MTSHSIFPCQSTNNYYLPPIPPALCRAAIIMYCLHGIGRSSGRSGVESGVRRCVRRWVRTERRSTATDDIPDMARISGARLGWGQNITCSIKLRFRRYIKRDLLLPNELIRTASNLRAPAILRKHIRLNVWSFIFCVCKQRKFTEYLSLVTTRTWTEQ